MSLFKIDNSHGGFKIGGTDQVEPNQVRNDDESCEIELQESGQREGGEFDKAMEAVEIQSRFLSEDQQVLTQDIFFDTCPCCSRNCMLIPAALILVVELVMSIVFRSLAGLAQIEAFGAVCGIGLYLTFIITIFLTNAKSLKIVTDKKNDTITFSAPLIQGDVCSIQKPLKDLVDMRTYPIYAEKTGEVLGNTIYYIFADFSVVEAPIPHTFNHGVFFRQMELFKFEGKVEQTTSYSVSKVEKPVGCKHFCKYLGKHLLGNLVFIGVINLILAFAIQDESKNKGSRYDNYY